MILDTAYPSAAVESTPAAPLSPEAQGNRMLFRSFWMGGFECATHINPSGQRLDMIAGTQHDVQAEHDYALLAGMGMRVARDGVRWHLIDRGGRYDWSSFEPMFEAAQRQGVQVIWDVCHYGWPDGVDVFSVEFVDRFARFAAALARWVKERSNDVAFYSPMNEISFLTWGASRDLIYPFAIGRDQELKRQLVRATVAGCAAILDTDPRARLVFPEPIVHVIPPRDRPDLVLQARQQDESQFEAWDMIAGLQDPELGGEPRFLDILGANFYHSNEWEIEGNGRLRWEDEPRDERWVPLHILLARVHRRYGRPLFLAETSHFGSGRARWINEIGNEVLKALEKGTPVEGVCLYPVIDRYDWQDSTHWHNSGLWDMRKEPDGKLVRVLNQNYAESLENAKEMLTASWPA